MLAEFPGTLLIVSHDRYFQIRWLMRSLPLKTAALSDTRGITATTSKG